MPCCSLQLLFSTEPRNSPTFATDSKYVLSTKVPIKLTSMNFEVTPALHLESKMAASPRLGRGSRRPAERMLCVRACRR